MRMGAWVDILWNNPTHKANAVPGFENFGLFPAFSMELIEYLPWVWPKSNLFINTKSHLFCEPDNQPSKQQSSEIRSCMLMFGGFVFHLEFIDLALSKLTAVNLRFA